MTDPQTARRSYKELAAEAGRLLHASEDARRRLTEAEESRTATYASVEREWAHLIGLEVSMALHDAGRVRWFAAGLPALLAPWLGHLAANGWIRYRTSHEEQEYAVDTAIAGAIGGGVVWLFALTFVIIRVATAGCFLSRYPPWVSRRTR